MPALDSVFEFLFKYRRSVFEAGDVSIGATVYAPLVLLGAAVAIGASLWSYRWMASRSRLMTRDLFVLAGLRVAAISLSAMALLEPTLRVLTVASQQTFVGVLIDDSQSLSIKDDSGRARSEFVRERLLDPAGDFRRSLDAKFKLRFFRFSSSAERLQRPRLDFAGTRTDLVSALQRAREELADVPLSGLILVTDGADNAAGPLSETLLDLRTRQIPVFTVGLGQASFTRDIEITRVEVPATVLQGSTVIASVALKAQGAGAQDLHLTVEDSGRILAAKDVQVSASDSSTVRLSVRADEPGPRLLHFKVTPISGEQVIENNEFDVALDVVGRREKVLYFEGAARFEAKIGRASCRERV